MDARQPGPPPLDQSGGGRARGRVFLVGAGPGDPGLITARAIACLAAADVIVADRLVAPEIIDRYAPARAERIVRPARRGRDPGRDDDGLDQAAINRLLVERALQGQIVVRLKGGDPFVFGRGSEEAEALVAAGVPFVVVPGVTAAVAAPAYAGIPLTHRGAAGVVAFATGHEADDKEGGAVDWPALARAAGTLVLYMSVGHLEAITRRLIAAGRAPAEPVAVIERGTTPAQRTIVGTLADIAARARAAAVRAPALTIVGDVVGLHGRIDWFERRPLRGVRLLVLATKGEDGLGPRDDGAEVLRVAPLAVRPLAEARARLDAAVAAAGTIALVSAHAVEALIEGLRGAGRDARVLAGKRLGAVGAATARALAGHFLAADVVADGGGAELAAALTGSDGASGDERDRRPVLVLGARDGRPELAEQLRAAGRAVEVLAVYETVPDNDALARALAEHRARPFHAIAFASPKGARAFFDHAGGWPALAAAAPPLVGAIGATTAAALTALGAPAPLVPPAPTLDALCDALLATLAARAQMG